MRSGLTRRSVLAGAGAAAASLALGCKPRAAGALRVGVMTNLTHAPAIAGLASGRIAARVGAPVEPRSFRAGPRVLEALVGDAIDIGVSGPAPVVYTHARHPGLLRVLSGCCSGGASFIVSRGSGITGAQDLRGKTLATPQIGTTQDISLRKYLRAHGYAPSERGGDVTVHALDASTILAQMQRGGLDGAWLPEPWATRVVQDAGATRLVDERDLWPARSFPTAIVVARSDFAKRAEPLVRAFVESIAEEVRRASAEAAGTRGLVREELGRLLGKKLPAPLVEEAWRFVDFTRDPLAGALDTIADDAWALGLAPRTSCGTLFV